MHSVDEIKKEIDDYVDLNFDWLRENINFVIGISRGGLIPAALIATKLDKPLIAAYINREDKIHFDCYDWIVNKNVLVVDDIRRSGKTLALLNEHLKTYSEIKNRHFMTIYYINSLNNKDYPDLGVRAIRTLDKDITFPWDYPRIEDNKA